MSDPNIVARQKGNLGHVTLNRPKAINALTLGMIGAIDDLLDEWTADPNVCAVLIDGAGERGLCAGGDIRFLYESVRSGHPEQADRFLHSEYTLNARIARLSKPYIAIMDGLVMGGGVGVSAHGSVRIVTERTRLAMPEVGIGFVPDIGSTHLLSVAPGELGTHAALTGESLSAADAILCGLADHHVPSDRLPALLEALSICTDAADIGRCVALHATRPPVGRLAADANWIDACYRHDTVQAILEALSAYPGAAAQAAAERIAGKCPTSLIVTLQALRQGRRLGRLDACLEQEYRLATGLLRQPDFAEGVRAAIIDKDRKPAWMPATLAGINPERIDALFRFDESVALTLV